MLMAHDDRKAIGEFDDRPVIGLWACEEPKDQPRPLDAFLAGVDGQERFEDAWPVRLKRADRQSRGMVRA